MSTEVSTIKVKVSTSSQGKLKQDKTVTRSKTIENKGISVLKEDRTKQVITSYIIIGKDEVAGSNPAISSSSARKF